MGAQNFAYYGRLIGSDGYFIDEDMKTLMHPQVMLAWLLNDDPCRQSTARPCACGSVPLRRAQPQGDHRD